ncbi:TlyA family RNA methyltransferase [Candidatus Desantisbacteria bacterium]|nr:TlyA family RNA methyltransferase [Candidatus Desantisbacteria bacterium]
MKVFPLSNKKPSRERLDKILVEKGFFISREKAQREIMAGTIFVDERCLDKPGTLISISSKIEIKHKTLPYVSRGGIKLEKALREFKIDATDKIILDIGASTGGFTDCLLKHNAGKIYAIDVGYGQIAWELQNNPKVIIKEKINARYLKPEDFPVLFNIIVIDVSFISLTKILIPAKNLLSGNGQIIALIKPQFEAGKNKVGKGGIISDSATHLEVIENIKQFSISSGLTPGGLIESPITGMDGNKEFFILLMKSKRVHPRICNSISPHQI